MLVFLQFVPFLILLVLATFGERYPVIKYITYGLLALVNAACVLVGLFFALAHLLVPYMQLDNYIFPDMNLWGVAIVLVLVAAVGFAVLLPGVRRWIARFTDTNPASPVQVTAFSFAAYYVGLSIGQILLVGGLEGLAAIPIETTPVDLLLSGLALTLFGFLGVGYPIRRRGAEALARLGLRRPTWRQLGIAAGAIAGFLLLDYSVARIWSALNPEQYQLIGRVSLGLFGEMDIWKAAAIGVSAGIGEEILFRGAVQPRFGLWITALLFTSGHTQYGLSPAILEVFAVGVILGVIRDKATTTTCVAIHVLYNFLDVVLLPLFP
jgi:membrane protease YdiL (CAAX protease family)